MSQILAKPPHGTACNGCGGCCMAGRCPLGAEVFGPGRGCCPALESQFPKFICGLIANPGKYAPQVVMRHGKAAASEAAAYMIGAGSGCDALVEGEKANSAWLSEWKKNVDVDKAARAARIWMRNTRKVRIL